MLLRRASSVFWEGPGSLHSQCLHTQECVRLLTPGTQLDGLRGGKTKASPTTRHSCTRPGCTLRMQNAMVTAVQNSSTYKK